MCVRVCTFELSLSTAQITVKQQLLELKIVYVRYERERPQQCENVTLEPYHHILKTWQMRIESSNPSAGVELVLMIESDQKCKS